MWQEEYCSNPFQDNALHMGLTKLDHFEDHSLLVLISL